MPLRVVNSETIARARWLIPSKFAPPYYNRSLFWTCHTDHIIKPKRVVSRWDLLVRTLETMTVKSKNFAIRVVPTKFPYSKLEQTSEKSTKNEESLLRHFYIDHRLGFVITLFLPLKFLRELARKTRQLDWAKFDLRVGQMHQKVLRTWPGAQFVRFGKVWPKLTGVDQVWLKFDQDHDQAKSKIWLTIFWPLRRAHQDLRFDTSRVENERKKRKL